MPALNTALVGPDVTANDDLGVPLAAPLSFGIGDATTQAVPGNIACGGTCSLTFNANGTFNFTPDNNFTGLFTFMYRLQSTAGMSDADVNAAAEDILAKAVCQTI